MHRLKQGRRASPRGRGAGPRLAIRGRRISQAMRRRSAVEQYAPAQQLSMLRWDLLELADAGRWLH